MREFLTESVLPLFGVGCLIWGLTVALFDVPRDPPPSAVAAAAASTPVISPGQAREQMNDVLARAMRHLDAARSPHPAELAPPAPNRASSKNPAASRAAIAQPSLERAPARVAAETDPGLIQAVSALGEAVRAVHEVRTEEDIVRAEERIRGAREQMEEACKAGGSGGPLCEGAAQMRSLGY